ncbi:protein kinase, Atypical group, partial [Reticulomyxa filosa]
SKDKGAKKKTKKNMKVRIESSKDNEFKSTSDMPSTPASAKATAKTTAKAKANASAKASTNTNTNANANANANGEENSDKNKEEMWCEFLPFPLFGGGAFTPLVSPNSVIVPSSFSSSSISSSMFPTPFAKDNKPPSPYCFLPMPLVDLHKHQTILINDCVERLLSVAMNDRHSIIRCTLLACFNNPLLYKYMCTPEVLHVLTVSLNDEDFNTRECAVRILGHLACYNSSLVMPCLRKLWNDWLHELAYSSDVTTRRESAELLGVLVECSDQVNGDGYLLSSNDRNHQPIRSSYQFVIDKDTQSQGPATLMIRHYVDELLHVMIPKLASKQEDIQVEIAILRVIGQLAQQASHAQVLELFEVLLPILVNLLEDQTLYLQKYVRSKKKRRQLHRDILGGDGKKSQKRYFPFYLTNKQANKIWTNSNAIGNKILQKYRKKHGRRMSSTNDLLMSITNSQGIGVGEDILNAMSGSSGGYSNEAMIELTMLKQCVTLETLGLIIQCTGFVIEPYIQQKNLMSLLLDCVGMTTFYNNSIGKTNVINPSSLFRDTLPRSLGGESAKMMASAFWMPNNEETVDVLSYLGWNIHREAIRAIGIIGALDPFLHNNNLITLTVLKSSRQMFHHKKRLELQKIKKRQMKRLRRQQEKLQNENNGANTSTSNTNATGGNSANGANAISGSTSTSKNPNNAVNSSSSNINSSINNNGDKIPLPRTSTTTISIKKEESLSKSLQRRSKSIKTITAASDDKKKSEEDSRKMEEKTIEDSDSEQSELEFDEIEINKYNIYTYIYIYIEALCEKLEQEIQRESKYEEMERKFFSEDTMLNFSCNDDDFYAYMVIRSLLSVLSKDQSNHNTSGLQSSHLYHDCLVIILHIFQLMGTKSLNYLPLVIPPILNIVELLDGTHTTTTTSNVNHPNFLITKANVLEVLSQFIQMVRSHVRPYLVPITTMIHREWDAWILMMHRSTTNTKEMRTQNSSVGKSPGSGAIRVNAPLSPFPGSPRNATTQTALTSPAPAILTTDVPITSVTVPLVGVPINIAGGAELMTTAGLRIVEVLLLLCVELSRAVRDEFRSYLHDLLPKILTILYTDMSDDRVFTTRALATVQEVGNVLNEYLHLVMPALVMLLTKPNEPIAIRTQCVDTITELCKSLSNFTTYANRVIHPLVRLLEETAQIANYSPVLQSINISGSNPSSTAQPSPQEENPKKLIFSIMNCLCSLLLRMNQGFAVYVPLVDRVECGLWHM